jgi:hypothetical protein
MAHGTMAIAGGLDTASVLGGRGGGERAAVRSQSQQGVLLPGFEQRIVIDPVTEERDIREAGERAGREVAERAASAHSPKCVVPSLKGDSLTQARRALGRARCRLGKLSGPRRYHGRLL